MMMEDVRIIDVLDLSQQLAVRIAMWGGEELGLPVPKAFVGEHSGILRLWI